MRTQKQTARERANKNTEREPKRQPDHVDRRETETGLDTGSETIDLLAWDHASLLSDVSSDEQLVNFAARLQRRYGNTYVQRLVDSVGVQAKMTVNPPGDEFEQEADRVADEVTRGGASGVQRQDLPEEEEELLQAKRDNTLQRQELPEEEELQLKPNKEAVELSKELEERLEGASDGGEALSDASRAFLEPQLGHDFSHVRIHADAEASMLSRELGAEAFTKGSDIFFREGAYQPDTTGGRGLIAHELTHVVQQSAAPIVQRGTESTTDATEEAMEEEENDAGDELASEQSTDSQPSATTEGPTSETPAQTGTSSETQPDGGPIDPARAALRSVWDSMVLGSLREAHRIEAGPGTETERSLPAIEALVRAQDTIDAISSSYRDNPSVHSGIEWCRSKIELFNALLGAFQRRDVTTLLDPEGRTYRQFARTGEML